MEGTFPKRRIMEIDSYSLALVYRSWRYVAGYCQGRRILPDHVHCFSDWLGIHRLIETTGSQQESLTLLSSYGRF